MPLHRLLCCVAAFLSALCVERGFAAPLPPITRPAQDEIVYQIMPIAWRDSNLDTVGPISTRFGDFGGLAATESLDYLQYLGVTMIYLQPIFPSAAYHGYQHGPADALNASFGTQAQFLAFVNAAHARGIKVILDFVAYGISQNSTYFTSAFHNPASAYDSFLAFTDSGNNTFVGSNYNTWNGAGVGFIHWDLTNPAVVTLITNWAKKWMDPNSDGDPSDGVDGFRLDHAWASGGEGWGANITFWETWCSSLRALRSDVFLFCEPSDWGNVGTDLLTPNAFDAVVTKPWEFAARTAVTSKLAAGLYSATATAVSAVPAGKLLIAEMNDHDSNRLASEFSSNNARQKVGAAILFTQPFPPNVYYGDELGMKGIKASVGSDANDIPMREPFKWKAVAGAPMTNYAAVTAGTPAPTYSANNDGRSVEEQKGVAGSLLESYRALIAVRQGSIALRRGSYIPVSSPHSGVFAFVRHEATQTVLVAINLDSASANTTLNLSGFTVPSAGTVPVSLENGANFPSITTVNKAVYSITLGARAWFITRAELTPPVSTSHADIDGRTLQFDAGASSLLATQTCLSSFADNAGELNQLFVRADSDALRVSISGNIPQDATALTLFIDVNPGSKLGQNELVTAHLPSPPGGIALLDGTTFDAGFRPDALYYINTVNSRVFVDCVTLATAPTLASKVYRGSSALNSGSGVLTGGTNPNQLEVALDNSNTAGISATSVMTAPTATKGVELRIPFADLGLAADFSGALAISACIERTDGSLSNQWLPALQPRSSDLGVAANLNNTSGQQFTTLVVGVVGDVDADGIVGGGDLATLLAAWGHTSAEFGFLASDLNHDDRVDAIDLGILLGNWS